MKYFIAAMLTAAAFTVSAEAQQTATVPVQPTIVTTTVNTPVGITTVTAPVPTKGQTPVTYDKRVAEVIAASSMKVVKGAPYSADAISESVQTLADGNKITRSYTVKMYRDSEGRSRREEVLNQGDSLLGKYNTISIFDPANNTRFFLNP